MSANPRDIPTMRMVVGSTDERYTTEGDISFGLIRYNTTDNNVEAYAKDGWVNLQGGGVGSDASLSSIVEYTDNSGITFLSDVSVNGVLNSTDGSFSGNLYSTSGIIGGASGWILGANGSSNYTFTGSGLMGSESNPTLNLFRGNKYIFINNTGGHPFQISKSDATSTAYGTGVTNNGGAGGSTITFEVPHDAPKTLKYICTAHSGAMYGDINIHGGGSAVDASFQSDVTIAGNLYVDGSFNFGEVIQNITTVNNELLISTQVDISNYGTGPALSVTQHGDGAGDNLVLLHAGAEGTAVEVKGDGKSIFYKDVDISGKLVLSGDISINGDLIYGGFADISSKVFLNTVTTTFNTGTIVDLSDVVTAMSTKFTTHDASFQNDVDISGKLVVNDDVSFNGDLNMGFNQKELLLAGAGALNGTGGLQGDATSSGTINYYASYSSRSAFNGALSDGNNMWASDQTSPKYIQFKFPYDVIVTKYKIWRGRNIFGLGDNYPKAWKLKGSNDGVTFVEIDDKTETDANWSATPGSNSIINDSERNEYDVDNTTTAYRTIRMDISDHQGIVVSIGELAFYGYRKGTINTRHLVVNNNVDVAGYIKHNNVRFSAYSTVGNVTKSGFANPFVLEKTFYNVGSPYSGSTGIFTSPVTGHYRFTLTIYRQSGTGVAALWYRSASGGTFVDAKPGDLMSHAGGDNILMTTAVSPVCGVFDVYVPVNNQIAFGGRTAQSMEIYQAHSFFSGELISPA